MSENIIPPIDSIPQELVPPVAPQTVPPTLPHAHFSWWALITISFVFLAGISGFLFWQNQVLRAKLVVSPSPTPLASPVSTSDPTDTWLTYTNTELGFSFKYPTGYQVVEKTPGFFIVTTIEDQSKSQVGISIETRLQKPYDNYTDAATYFSKTFSQSKIRSITDLTNDEKDHQVSWTLFDGVGKIGQLEGLRFNIAYKQYKTGVITVEAVEQPNYSAIFDTFISTFEFTDDLYTSSTYTCPDSGYVDCMPVLDEVKKKACSEEAMTWYKTNCPGFKGGAL